MTLDKESFRATRYGRIGENHDAVELLMTVFGMCQVQYLSLRFSGKWNTDAVHMELVRGTTCTYMALECHNGWSEWLLIRVIYWVVKMNPIEYHVTLTSSLAVTTNLSPIRNPCFEPWGKRKNRRA